MKSAGNCCLELVFAMGGGVRCLACFRPNVEADPETALARAADGMSTIIVQYCTFKIIRTPKSLNYTSMSSNFNIEK